jgi:uncharacterized protein YbjT (DUF2867 family)
MKVIIFGATGMVGRGVLRECLLDPEVERVLLIGRSPVGQRHEKIHETVRADVTDLSGIEAEFAQYDACFFCLGVTSVGRSAEDYRRVTYDITLAAAKALSARNPAITFTYVSGMGVDTTEQGRVMWARTKGATENALLSLFPHAYMFRPGIVHAVNGERSRTWWYQAVHTVMTPVNPLLRRLLPGVFTTTETMGRAMLTVTRRGWRVRVLPNREINIAGGR